MLLSIQINNRSPFILEILSIRIRSAEADLLLFSFLLFVLFLFLFLFPVFVLCHGLLLV